MRAIFGVSCLLAVSSTFTLNLMLETVSRSILPFTVKSSVIPLIAIIFEIGYLTFLPFSSRASDSLKSIRYRNAASVGSVATVS